MEHRSKFGRSYKNVAEITLLQCKIDLISFKCFAADWIHDHAISRNPHFLSVKFKSCGACLAAIGDNEQCRSATLIAADQIISRNFERITFLIIWEKQAVGLMGSECPLQIAVLEWFAEVASEFLHGEHPVLIQKPQCRSLSTVVLGIIFIQREFCPVGDCWQHQADWGEWLKMDLLDAWLLRGEDAKCWNKVSNMKGVIDGHNLDFDCGFAVADVPVKRDEYGSANEPVVLFKVQDYFFAEDGFVYAKVIGDEPSYCYMPCSYTPPTYIVKVNNLGRIVKWYRYPRFVKTLKEFFGQSSRAVK